MAASKRRSDSRRASAASQLLAAGLAIIIVPVFLKGSIVTSALVGLRPLAIVMVLIGIFLLALPHLQASLAKSAASALVQRPPTFNDPAAAQRQEPGLAPQQWGRDVFDVIEWRRFEAVVERLFSQGGFQTRSQSHGPDGGVDIWLYSKNMPGTPVSLVQCKHWQGKKVGVDKVRELRGVIAAHSISRGQFVTTSTFTEEAVAFANQNGINVLDVDSLLRLIDKRSPQEQEALLAVAFEGDYARPTCASCGVKMVERAPSKGGSPFWGCKNFPRCKTTMPMRRAAA